MLTTLGEGFANLSTETADLKKAFKVCEKAMQAATAIKAMPDRVQAAMTNLIDKQEVGEHVHMVAEYAQDQENDGSRAIGCDHAWNFDR